MAKVWARIRETIERHGAAGLISVIGAAGSVPREAGARVVLQPDGGFFGTVGGGRLEYEAIAAARAVLAAGRGKAQFRDWPLGPNLGQCCGGMVKTLTETFDRNDLVTVHRFEQAEKAGAFDAMSRLADDGRIVRTLTPHEPAKERAATTMPFNKTSFHESFGEVLTPVLLFGAGHVGRAVVLALAPLPFAVRWIDSRPDQFPQYVAAECRHRPHRRCRLRTGRRATGRHGHCHDSLPPDRFRHHRRGAAAGCVRICRPDRLGYQAVAVCELGPADGRDE